MRGTRKLLRNVMTLPEGKTGRNLQEVNILIDHDRIAEVNPGVEFAPGTGEVEDLDCRGLLAMPGLINGHFHSSTNLMKGQLDGLPLELFMLHEVPPLADTPPPDRLVYVRTMLGAIEMLKLGITSVQDRCVFRALSEPREHRRGHVRLFGFGNAGNRCAGPAKHRRVREVSVPQGPSSRGHEAQLGKGSSSLYGRTSRSLRLPDRQLELRTERKNSRGGILLRAAPGHRRVPGGTFRYQPESQTAVLHAHPGDPGPAGLR